MLDIEGVHGVEEISLIGDEATVNAGLDAIAAPGRHRLHRRGHPRQRWPGTHAEPPAGPHELTDCHTLV